jgi:hypothetical protein
MVGALSRTRRFDSTRLGQQRVPVVGWVASLEHLAEGATGVVRTLVRAARVLVIDPRIDDDATRRVVAEEQAVLLKELRATPVRVCTAERVSLPILRARRVGGDHLEREALNVPFKDAFALSIQGPVAGGATLFPPPPLSSTTGGVLPSLALGSRQVCFVLVLARRSARDEMSAAYSLSAEASSAASGVPPAIEGA